MYKFCGVFWQCTYVCETVQAGGYADMQESASVQETCRKELVEVCTHMWSLLQVCAHRPAEVGARVVYAHLLRVRWLCMQTCNTEVGKCEDM